MEPVEVPENELLPPTWRKPAYRIYGLIGVLLGAATVGFAAVPSADIPQALIVANAVYVFLGGPFGFVAQHNVPMPFRR